MTLNVIHLPARIDRIKLLQREFLQHNITDYKIWDGIVDPMSTIRGVSQAHKQIVRYAKEMNLTEILIGEDDLHFTSSDAFEYFLNNKPLDYDIYLGGIYYGTLKEDYTVEDFSGLTLYLVNQRFYDLFLSIPENKHLDRALRKTGRFCVCDPQVVVQHNGYSDNSRQYCNYNI